MDDKTAQAAGHPSIILHGLCTMAFAGRAVVNGFLGGDPERLKRFKARFSMVVLPGMELTTRGWIEEERDGEIVLGLETINQDGKTVLANAMAVVSK
jgi:acyl dehydratase